MTENKNMAENTGESIKPKANEADPVVGGEQMPTNPADFLASMMGRSRTQQPETGDTPKDNGTEEGQEQEISKISPEVHAKLISFAEKVQELRPETPIEDIQNGVFEMISPQTSPDDAIQHARKLFFTKDDLGQLEQILRDSEVPEPKIKLIIEKAKAGGLPDKEKVEDLTETEQKDLEEAHDEDGGIDQLQDVTGEGKSLMNRVASGEAVPQEEIEEYHKKADTIMDSVRKKFFYGEDSILRAEDRVKRLLVKPLVTILLVTMVAYLACLSSLTRGSATRIGK